MGLLVACSSGDVGQVAQEAGGGQGQATNAGAQPAGEARADILPVDLLRGGTLTLVPQGFQLEDATVEWLLNNVPVPGAASMKFSADAVKRDDQIQARVTLGNRQILSNTVTVKNAPPEFTKIKLMPEVFQIGDTLYMDVVTEDADGDEVVVRYDWVLNGEPAGSDRALGVPVKRGDTIEVRLTATDGISSSQPVVLKKSLRNLPPMIAEDAPMTCDKEVCTWQVSATDPDGDRLAYSVKTGTQGLSIDADTGLVEWKVPLTFRGRETVVIAVTDGNGGESTKSYILSTPE